MLAARPVETRQGEVRLLVVPLLPPGAQCSVAQLAERPVVTRRAQVRVLAEQLVARLIRWATDARCVDGYAPRF